MRKSSAIGIGPALLLSLVLHVLTGCAGLAEIPGERQDKVSKLETAHGGPEQPRGFLELHTEGDIRVELGKFDIGYQIYGPEMSGILGAKSQSLATCVKFFPDVDRSKWHRLSGELYYIDRVGRPSRAQADLPPIKAEARQNTCQTSIGQWGDAENPANNYDGGHLIGSQLGGWGGRANIVPQEANFNRGTWAQLENGMAKCGVLEAKAMHYSIEVEYPNELTLIPSAFSMTIARRSDGVKVELRFANQIGGGIYGAGERARGTDFLKDNGCV